MEVRVTKGSKAGLTEWITAWLRTELGLPDAPLEMTAPFTRFGMDSVHALMMTGDLEEHLGRRLSPTVAWDHPTVDALSTFLSTPAGAGEPV
jgi:acyl carrier protein